MTRCPRCRTSAQDVVERLRAGADLEDVPAPLCAQGRTQQRVRLSPDFQHFRLSPDFQHVRLSPDFQGVRLSPAVQRVRLSPSFPVRLSRHEPTPATMTSLAGLDKDCWVTTAFHACPMAETVEICLRSGRDLVDAGSAAAAVLLL